MGRRHLLLTAVLLGAAGLTVPVVATAATGSTDLDQPLGPAVVASLDPDAAATPTAQEVSTGGPTDPDDEDDDADDGDDRAESVDVPEVDDADDDEADDNEDDEDEPDEDEPDEQEDGDGDPDDGDDD